MIEFYSA
jgi:hypothetical protein